MILLHNPRCSKSREALKLLEEQGKEVQVRKYLEEPLEKEELEQLLLALNLPLSQVIRKQEAIYKELIQKESRPSEETLFNWTLEHPLLLERPLFIVDKKAVIGRPPERVLELL
jgi:arsenate reductase